MKVEDGATFRILRVFEKANINRLIERYIVCKHLQSIFLPGSGVMKPKKQAQHKANFNVLKTL